MDYTNEQLASSTDLARAWDNSATVRRRAAVHGMAMWLQYARSSLGV